MADALRGSMDAAEYKHVCLGLLFLKYISDAFEEHQNKLKSFLQNSVLARPAVRYAVKQQNVEFVQPVCWFVFTI